MINAGRMPTSVACADGRNRPRGLERRLPSLKGRGLSSGFEDFETDVLEALERAAETDGPTCVLDMVQDGRSYTLEAIGDLLSLSKERLRQVETAALVKLETVLRDDNELADWEDTRKDRGGWDGAL